MKQSKLFSKVFLIVVVCFLLTVKSYSYILENGSGKGYEPPKTLGYGMENSIETYIVKGGGYFLKSYSEILLILNKVEMSDVNGCDYNDWQSILKSALYNMRSAKNTYDLLIKTAEATPYNQEVIAGLEKFDYAYFVQTNNLNAIIFKDVEQRLKSGDITSCYKNLYSHMCAIESVLVSVLDEVTLNKMPRVALLWKLNGIYAEALLSGQYVAMIFNEI